MKDQLKSLWFNPLTGKLLSAVIALLVVFALGRLLLRSVEHYVNDNDARYRARKVVSFTRYAISLVALAIIFSERLAGFTVVFGVAGAGIAFALQEVIASIAGWMAISSGGFYSIGDRVQVGGIRGDVIDIGVLRTTVMEVGQWVEGDLYNGRIASRCYERNHIRGSGAEDGGKAGAALRELAVVLERSEARHAEKLPRTAAPQGPALYILSLL